MNAWAAEFPRHASMFVLLLAVVVGRGAKAPAEIENGPATPHIDSVTMVDPQPHENDPAVIWYDNFVISTKPIGPVVSSPSPVLTKTPYRGPGNQRSWEVELAADSAGQPVVWKSKENRGSCRVKVSMETGQFLGSLSGCRQLEAASVYYVRVRQQSDAGRWSAWSPWHQPIRTR